MTVYVLKEGTLCAQNDSGALKFPQKNDLEKGQRFLHTSTNRRITVCASVVDWNNYYNLYRKGMTI